MKKRTKIVMLSLCFMLILIFIRTTPFEQHKIEPTIEILIDRAPNGLSAGQPLDITGRKFEPLLADYEIVSNTDPDRIELRPRQTHSNRPHLRFTVIKDETTRALKFLKGEADVLYDSLAITKTEWIKKQNNTYRVYSRSGLRLSYLGFSSTHPILKNLDVRRALAQALPVQDWIKYKLLNWVDASIEYLQIPYAPEGSMQTLDRLGYRPNSQGVRFKLKYLTTAVREGNETALLVQEALKKIGVEVDVITLDSILFFQKLKRGDADLFSSTWHRASEQEPIDDLLSTGAVHNYFGYSHHALDLRLKHNPVLSPQEITKILTADLPFYPLYNWKHGLILGPRIKVEEETRLVATLDDSFRFLELLGLK